MARMPCSEDEVESDQRWLKRLARRMARSPASAEDLVQETYLTALGKPAPDGPMRPWLAGVLRKLAWREIRSGERRARREECFVLTGDQVAEPDPLLAYGIDRARLRSVLEELPEPYRSTVEKRFLDGLSCAEIARAAGVPPGTIRWRQSRGLELLRTSLERPRPRRSVRGLLWLPLVGLERAASAGARALEASGRGRGVLVLIGLALVAILAAQVARDEPVVRGASAAESSSAASVGVSHAATLPGLGALPAGVEAALVSAALGGGDDEIAVVDGVAGADGDSRSERAAGGRGVGPAPSLRDLYDCTDGDGELRCERRRVSVDPPEQVGGPVCLLLERSLDALGRALPPAPGMASARRQAFLRAATLANRLLASELGCALTPEPERKRGGGRGDDEDRGGGAPVARAPEPSCRSEEDQSGRSCTTCTDAQGVESTVCAPVECEAATRTDGTPCTRCTDSDGQAESDCEVEGEPDGCAPLTRDLGRFAGEVLPVLTGQVDLNDPEALQPLTGCTRGPCHGIQREGLWIDVADSIEHNLERFACFVDLDQPELSQVILCAQGDDRCSAGPHPGAELLTGPEDLNFVSVLAFIQANAR